MPIPHIPSSSRPFLPRIPFLCLIILLPSLPLCGQNLPDRIVVLDPLGDTSVAGDGFVLLPGARLYGEFARYTNGSGTDHRWNAKTGGYGEFARWDSTWSIAGTGTMEVIIDPNNDISFNPRAIFWEEGLIISARAPWGNNQAIQFGYIHRCKHDIDNIEILRVRGELEQRTLIYSGPFIRLLARPTKVLDGPLNLYLGSALRYDHFVHKLDERWNPEYAAAQPNVEDLKGTLNATVTVEGRFGNNRLGFHAGANWMLAFATPRGGKLGALGSLPFVEFGVDIYNPRGAAFTIFARGEYQRDGGIRTEPTAADLLLFGVRISSFEGMW